MSGALASPSHAEAFRVWLKIGLLSFGGPAGQIALMHRVLVDEKKWIGEERFLHGLNFCMLLPGPEAMQLATYIGWLLHGVRGGLTAGLLFVLPGFCVIMALSTAYALFSGQIWFASIFFGLKAAVLAVVIEALLRVAKKSLKSRAAYGLAALSFLSLFCLGVPFPLVVLGAGVIGYVGERMSPGWLGGPRAAPATLAQPQGGGWGHAFGVLATWGALWVLPILLAGALLGWDSVFPTLAVFFSKMAVVTFGGAYAVLAYVAQAAVDTFGWLKPGQMIDGLALAETTPGPLILVLTFVGFIAAFQNSGALPPLLAGVIGGTLTTWVTFVPCFLWIFLGAPYIERLRANPALSGALSAIGAAVVGVILNLSLWFALQTLFGKVNQMSLGPLHLSVPDVATLDWRALLLAIAAMIAMFRLHLGMLPVLGLSALLGLLLKAFA